MRSDSRLQYAEFLPYNVRYPILLPRKNWVTKQIVKYYHEMGNHNAGTNQCSVNYRIARKFRELQFSRISWFFAQPRKFYPRILSKVKN